MVDFVGYPHYFQKNMAEEDNQSLHNENNCVRTLRDHKILDQDLFVFGMKCYNNF